MEDDFHWKRSLLAPPPATQFPSAQSWGGMYSLLFQRCCYCCCWVASVVSDSVWPHRRQPTRLRHPWDSPCKNTGVGCHLLLQCMKVKSESEVAQSCPTLRDPMDCSLPDSSVHGIFQARVPEWGAIAFSERYCIHIQLNILMYLLIFTFTKKKHCFVLPFKICNVS